MVEDSVSVFGHKIDNVTILKEIINLEGHPNRITGSTVPISHLKKENNTRVLSYSESLSIKILRLCDLLSN